MGFIKGIINTVADPRLFFTLAVVGLFLVIWKREKVASNAFGYGALGLLLVFFVFGTFDPKLVTRFVRVGTYPTRNFATLGPL